MTSSVALPQGAAGRKLDELNRKGGPDLRHAHEAGDLGGHAQVAEEALVGPPERAPCEVPPPTGLFIAYARLHNKIEPFYRLFLA